MDEKAEDMFIAFYLTGEGEKGFDDAHFKKFLLVMKLIEEVREKMKETRGC